MQHCVYGLPEKSFLQGTKVNKLPVDAPNPSGWHHANGLDPLGRNASWLGGGSSRVGRREQSPGASLCGGARQRATLRRSTNCSPPISSITTCFPAKTPGARASCRE